MCHNAFASSKVMDTLRFADVTIHIRQPAKDAQIAGRMIVNVVSMFFPFCFCVLHAYNGSFFRHISEMRI